MLSHFLKNNLFRNNIAVKNINNLYETRDCLINQIPNKFNEYKNYYETEAFKEYKPNLKSDKNKEDEKTNQ